MQSYTELVTELINDAVADYQAYNKKISRKDVLNLYEAEGFGDLFGNMTGSRTCSTYKAQQFINQSGALWDDEIIELYEEMGEDYMAETLKRGAEVFDVVTCELVASRVLAEMLA